jgi:hypothetical protein
MLEHVTPERDYLSPSGLRFKVLYLAKHGQDCSHPMVVYTNLERTHDRPVGEIWVVSERIFRETFREAPPLTPQTVWCLSVKHTTARYGASRVDNYYWHGDLTHDDRPEMAKRFCVTDGDYVDARRDGEARWHSGGECTLRELTLEEYHEIRKGAG